MKTHRQICSKLRIPRYSFDGCRFLAREVSWVKGEGHRSEEQRNDKQEARQRLSSLKDRDTPHYTNTRGCGASNNSIHRSCPTANLKARQLSRLNQLDEHALEIGSRDVEAPISGLWPGVETRHVGGYNEHAEVSHP